MDNFKNWLGEAEFIQLCEFDWSKVTNAASNMAYKTASAANKVASGYNKYAQTVAGNPYARDAQTLAKKMGISPEAANRMLQGDNQHHGGNQLSPDQQAQYSAGILAQHAMQSQAGTRDASGKVVNISITDAIKAYNSQVPPNQQLKQDWLSSPLGQKTAQIFQQQMYQHAQQHAQVQKQRQEDRGRHGYTQQTTLDQIRETDPGRYIVLNLTNSHPQLSKLRNQVKRLEISDGPDAPKVKQMKQQFDGVKQAIFSNPSISKMIGQLRMMQGKPEFQQQQQQFSQQIYQQASKIIDRTLNPRQHAIM